MFTRTAVVLSVVLLCGPAAGAQDAPPGEPGSQKPPSPPVERAKQARPPEPTGQPVNVRVDLTIVDEVAPGGPAKRTVTMVVADGTGGSIRSTGNQVQARLFVDAAPRILPDGSIQVQLGLDYNPQQRPAEDPGPEILMPGAPRPVGGSSLNERITVVLTPGKPLVVSQASDPLSDRKITVEVRATVLK